MTRPFTFRAARPAVCVSDRLFLKKPSLSASKTATSDTSGKSKPSLKRFTPTKTSNTPSRKSLKISTRSRVSTSECMYLTFILSLEKYLVSSSAILLVRVVTKIRSLISILLWISPNKSSIWLMLGRTSIGGSRRPVGRTICSTTTPSVCSSS